jgi:hypothetical protein
MTRPPVQNETVRGHKPSRTRPAKFTRYFYIGSAPSWAGPSIRWFAAGYAVMIVLYIAAAKFAVTDVWSYLAKAIFNA